MLEFHGKQQAIAITCHQQLVSVIVVPAYFPSRRLHKWINRLLSVCINLMSHPRVIIDATVDKHQLFTTTKVPKLSTLHSNISRITMAITHVKVQSTAPCSYGREELCSGISAARYHNPCPGPWLITGCNRRINVLRVPFFNKMYAYIIANGGGLAAVFGRSGASAAALPLKVLRQNRQKRICSSQPQEGVAQSIMN